MFNYLAGAVILIGIVVLPIVIIYNKTIGDRRVKEDIANEFITTMNGLGIDGSVTYPKRSFYKIKIETKNDIFLIMYSMMGPQKELFVAKKYRWQIEGGSAGYLFMKGIEPFIRGKYESTEKNVKKIVVLYPTSLNTMIYVNDVQTEFITPKIDVYGTRIINLDELHDKFLWLLDDEHTSVRH